MGSLLCSDGTSDSELNRRLGAARDTFSKLCRVWGHTNIPVQRKLEIYSACILSKLTYNLHALALNIAEQRKLDAFHARCLRKILRIPMSFLSKVSNESVLQQASTKKLSKIILQRQLDLLHRLALRSGSDIMRQSVFKQGSFEFNLPVGPKIRGRPKRLWAQVMMQHAVTAAGSTDRLVELWQHGSAAQAVWSKCLHQYCS